MTGKSWDHIERIGKCLPHPTLLFVWLCVLVPLGSWLAAWFDFRAVHPVSGETIRAFNLLSQAGLERALENAVANFTGFAPVGTVLLALMGIGVAEHSGLLHTLLRAVVLRTPPKLLSFTVALAGVLSSLAADAGYVVVVPLAGMLFAAAGRSPVVGIAVAFAAVSGGFSANLVLGPVDAILAGISTEAARIIDPSYQVSVAGNYYFMVASTLLVTALCTLVTEFWVTPRLEVGRPASPSALDPLDERERAGLQWALALTLGFGLLIVLGLVPQNGVLRDATTGSVLDGPFMRGIVVVVALWAALCGGFYGWGSGRYRHAEQIIEGMESGLSAMGSYLVLMFFAAQFVNFFSWSGLGAILAIRGASFLQTLSLPPLLLLIAFTIFSGVCNLFIGSASAKWALLAPIFVPMFHLLGLAPEASQVAYRIGDSATNIVTPLMPYFPLVVAFLRRYDERAGVGTLLAIMVPYSLTLLLGWSAFLSLWLWSGLPLGPGSAAFLR